VIAGANIRDHQQADPGTATVARAFPSVTTTVNRSHV
jgi:hypothetical protein